jgi:hypothetical protein
MRVEEILMTPAAFWTQAFLSAIAGACANHTLDDNPTLVHSAECVADYALKRFLARYDEESQQIVPRP